LKLTFPLTLNIVLLLAAAKAHGRQMRLERLALGHAIQGFQRGINPPWVEARWAWERRWFWGLYPVWVLVLYFALGGSWWLPLQAFSSDLSWMGFVAWLHLERDIRARRSAIQALLGADWIGRSRRDSALGWSLVLGLGALSLFLH
jgi:hypothetical protein